MNHGYHSTGAYGTSNWRKCDTCGKGILDRAHDRPAGLTTPEIVTVQATAKR